MPTPRTAVMTVAAVAAAGFGGAAIAGAAGNGSTTTTTPAATAAPQGQPPAGQPPQGRPPRGGAPGPHTVNGKTEQALTGDTAAKVKAAALARVSGTVERVETNVDSDAPYEAHIRKSDGTEVEVQVDKDFTVAAVNAMQHP